MTAAASGGQWTAGAGELVRLVYTEGITAVLGPADSRSAHLAEQVVARAKGRFVLLTPWASDPTLTQIKVPWFFRLVPDDRRQAEALLEEVHGARALHTAVAIVAPDPSSRTALEALRRAAMARHASAPRELLLSADAAALERLAAQVCSTGAEAVLFLGPPALAARAAGSLRAAGIGLPFFGPLSLASAAFLDNAGAAAEGMTLAAPAPSTTAGAEQFRTRYRSVYQREPSTPAEYAYDGAAVLLAALRSSAAGGAASVAAALASTHHEGLTGRIEFDPHGNRIGPVPLSQIEHGHLQAPRHAGDGAALGLPTNPQPSSFGLDERIRS